MAIYSGFSHKKWLFSIVMLVYQRVSEYIHFFTGTAPASMVRCPKTEPKERGIFFEKKDLSEMAQRQ